MKIQIPEKVNLIIETLMAAGYEAYAVGGCVRDTILGREPNDWDITTSAKPEEVKKLFSRTIDTGIAHGTVTVMMGKDGFEVTTYRIDGEYEDARHPKEVTFCSNLQEDLKRRDFTINAMAYNNTDGMIDIFGGESDIENKMIRCVGEAKERFTEDALRIMRAVRFSAQLGYEIEEKTLLAIREMSPNLSRISAERVREELTKLLESPNPDFLLKAFEGGITKVVLPEFDQKMESGLGEKILRYFHHTNPDRILRYSLLFYGDEAEAKTVLRRLRFDNDTITKVTKLSRYFLMPIETDEISVRKAVSEIGRPLFPMLMMLRSAVAEETPDDTLFSKEQIGQIIKQYDAIIKRGDCLTLKELAVTGADLSAHGIAQGKEMGDILRRLLNEVLEHPEENEKEILLGKIG